MILEILSGFVVSITGILFFLSLKFNNSISIWIIKTSRFIYYSGHPLLDDDAKFDLITKMFKNVFVSLIVVILKMIALLIFVLLLVGVTSIVIIFIKGDTLPNYQSTELLNALFPAYLYHFPFIIGSFIPILIIPFFIKKTDSEKGPYSPIDKLLHYVFLGNRNIARFLLRIELSRNRKVLKTLKNTQNVYVSGMARAGTTVLMQYLGQMSQFESLSYRNLPLLFLPKTGLKLSSKKKGQEKERSHKDGMIHSIDSYEALEEPFWRNYHGMEYIKEDHLVSHIIDSKVYQRYNSFRKLIAGDKIYLAKNNNHLLRATSLHNLDLKIGNSTQTVIPFREPYSQAKSLLNQHQILSQLQKEDEFVHDYMDFLVHHEFGLSHKVSVLDHEIDLNDLPEDIKSLDYWLEIWFLFYSKAYSLFSDKDGFHFFCYEEFCNNPHDSLLSLISNLKMSENLIDSLPIKKYDLKKSPDIEPKKKYTVLYNKLVIKSINSKNG